MLPSTRPLHVVCVLAAIMMLPACAGTKPKAVADAKHGIVIKGKDAKDYRFDMTQRGKKMSADDFDAWMKANGLRVAKGPVAKGSKAEAASGKRKGKRD